jgi:hypothetical protein
MMEVLASQLKIAIIADHCCNIAHEHKYMPMMPPDADLKNHLANRRSLAEARATYVAPCSLEQPSQNNVHVSQAVREEIAALQRGAPPG